MEMLKRILTSLVALCVLIPVLFLSNTWVLPIALSICCFIANYEVLKCIGCVSVRWVSSSLMSISSVIPLLVRIISPMDRYYIAVSCVLFAEILYLMAVIVFSKGNIDIQMVGIASLMSFYVTLGFSSIIILHDFFSGGKYLYLLVFVGAWVTDIFAYFCGKLFGKHKLIPEVSPKKTVEGSIGGSLFAGLAFVLFGIISNSLGFVIEFGHLKLFILGLIAAVVAQIGDLCMSALKRHYSIKDFGKIFPGHGGMLDRFDSIIAVAIVLLILNTAFTKF